MKINGDCARGKESLVDVKGLRLCISSRTLVEEFSLRLEEGRRIGLTGPSGCGKTTLLRSIVGRNLMSGAIAERFEITGRRIGYVPQQGGMLPWYSVRRNLHISATLSCNDRASWCDDVLASVELISIGASFPEQLSGGELQRARLACAIAVQPALYCVDEPLTEVGLKQRWKVLERWFFDMSERRAGLILVSHDVDTLSYLCDEVVILGGGPGQPAKIVSRLDVSADPHPRNPIALYSVSFELIRRQLVEILYVGERKC